MIAAAALALMQATPINRPPLQPGRWIFSESVDRTSGARGVSASLLSSDRNARLVVRCDITNDHTVSIQYLPSRRLGMALNLPISLARVESSAPFPLIWEPGPNGVYARDGVEDAAASAVAADLSRTPGLLRVTSADYDGTRVEIIFDDREGRGEIDRILQACPWPAATETAR